MCAAAAAPMLVVLFFIGGTAVLGKLYTAQTLALLALPIGYAIWSTRGPRATTVDATEGATVEGASA